MQRDIQSPLSLAKRADPPWRSVAEPHKPALAKKKYIYIDLRAPQKVPCCFSQESNNVARHPIPPFACEASRPTMAERQRSHTNLLQPKAKNNCEYLLIQGFSSYSFKAKNYCEQLKTLWWCGCLCIHMLMSGCNDITYCIHHVPTVSFSEHTFFNNSKQYSTRQLLKISVLKLTSIQFQHFAV